MSFLETVRRAKAYLQEQRRVSQGALQREFDLDSETVEPLVAELVDVQQVAKRAGEVLVWIGPAATDDAQPPAADALASNTVPSGERRQVTVLFCDLVGSTELAARLDPEEWQDIAAQYQRGAAETVTRFGGHVAKFLGDGLLCLFGWPQAHEDDAERAVRTGLAIVERVSSVGSQVLGRNTRRPAPIAHLSVRVGIHTGAVVIGHGGGDAPDVFGDTPNVAARLQSVAAPDAVVLSGATLRLVPGIFVTQDLGGHVLKGFARPLAVHQAVRPSGVRSRLDVAAAAGLTPLVGREQDLGLLDDRFAQVREGHGHAVLIAGEAGIGKSRLVQAFRERLAERAHTWLECRASPYTQHSGLYPVLDLQRQGLGFMREDTPETKLERIEVGLAAAGFNLSESVPLMAAFHSAPLDKRYEAPNLTPERLRSKTLGLLVEWLLRLGREQPVVLLMEDLHWLDPSTLELLGQVLEQLPTSQVLLLATYRPDFESPWGMRSHLTPMLLSRLTRAQLADLVRQAARGNDLPELWVEEIIRRSDGVPLFAEELTKAALETHREAPRDGEVPTLHIPETLQDSLMARLDALGPVKELAQLGAVLGREFSYDLLLNLSPLKEDHLRDSLAHAVREELFYQRGIPPDATYLFKHSLIRDAAYQSLLRSSRQRHHGLVAEMLINRMPQVAEAQPELVAYHLTEAGGLEDAITYWHRAGERATRRMENAEAIRHLRKGLELIGELPAGRRRDEDELPLQMAIAAPLMALKGYASSEVEHAYGRGRELCAGLGDAPQLVQVLFGAALYHYARGQLRASADLGRQLLHLASRSGEASHFFLGHLALGLSLFDQGESVDALENLERAMVLYDAGRDRDLVAAYGWDVEVLGRSWAARCLWQLGHPDRALVRSHEAVERGDESPYAHSLAHAQGGAAIVYHMLRQRAQVQQWAERVMATAEKQALATWLGAGRILRGWARADRGCTEGVDDIQQAMAQLAPTGFQLGAPYFLGLLAEAQCRIGRRNDALGTLDAALDVALMNDNRFWDAELLRLKGELLLEQGRSEGGEALLRQALELSQRKQWRAFELRTATSLARLWQGQGKRKEAHDLLRPTYDWFTEGFDTQDLKNAKALLDELSA